MQALPKTTARWKLLPSGRIFDGPDGKNDLSPKAYRTILGRCLSIGADDVPEADVPFGIAIVRLFLAFYPLNPLYDKRKASLSRHSQLSC
jgi:hypothetical protein